MSERTISGECESCESSFQVGYVEELVSQDLPEHCPFCGELIQEIQEEYIDDEDDDLDEEQWD